MTNTSKLAKTWGNLFEIWCNFRQNIQKSQEKCNSENLVLKFSLYFLGKIGRYKNTKMVINLDPIIKTGQNLGNLFEIWCNFRQNIQKSQEKCNSENLVLKFTLFLLSKIGRYKDTKMGINLDQYIETGQNLGFLFEIWFNFRQNIQKVKRNVILKIWCWNFPFSYSVKLAATRTQKWV